MATIHFDSNYAPCGFLIVKTDGNPYNDADTVLIQTDWDYPSVASRMGFDGDLIDCETCRTNVETVLTKAYEFIRENQGKEFSALDEYFNRD